MEHEMNLRMQVFIGNVSKNFVLKKSVDRCKYFRVNIWIIFSSYFNFGVLLTPAIKVPPSVKTAVIIVRLLL